MIEAIVIYFLCLCKIYLRQLRHSCHKFVVDRNNRDFVLIKMIYFHVDDVQIRFITFDNNGFTSKGNPRLL